MLRINLKGDKSGLLCIHKWAIKKIQYENFIIKTHSDIVGTQQLQFRDHSGKTYLGDHFRL